MARAERYSERRERNTVVPPVVIPDNAWPGHEIPPPEDIEAGVEIGWPRQEAGDVVAAVIMAVAVVALVAAVFVLLVGAI